MTQRQIIMHELNRGKSLTSMDGLRLGLIRLTNRVNELRASGIPILDTWETNNGKRYKRYYLKR